MLSKHIPLGIYEKALPAGECWLERLQLAKEKALPAGECWLERLQLAKALGFDFVEMSVDETDARLARLDWSREQRFALVNAIAETGVRVPSMCLSAHRRFPLGSEDDAVRAQGLEIMRKAIRLAQDVGIRVIQLAGYDVYYQEANNETRRRFRDGLKEPIGASRSVAKTTRFGRRAWRLCAKRFNWLRMSAFALFNWRATMFTTRKPTTRRAAASVTG